MGRCLRAAALVIVTLWACWAYAQGETASATVSLSPVQDRTLPAGFPGHPSHVERHQEAAFSFGPLPYTISCQACVDPIHGPGVAPLEGYIGMPHPSACNWYHSGFLFIALNGQDIGATPLSSFQVAESGRRAVADLVWHHPLADVRVRFLGLPGPDCLYCEIALDPKQEITSVGVMARCYPSFFTAAYNRSGARRIQTPATVLRQGETVTVPAADNWWALYDDEVFDVANGEGEGPCAVMLLPDEATEIAFRPGSYGVDTSISYPPTTRRLRLAFWDLRGTTNAAALSRLRDRAETTRQELATLDFTPAAVVNLDLTSLRADVERAAASEAIRAHLGEKLTAVQQWLAGSAPRPGQPTATATIAAQESLLGAVSSYYGFMWEIKLAELLAGI